MASFNFNEDLEIGHKIIIGLVLFTLAATFIGLPAATIITGAFVVVQLLPGLMEN